MLLCNATVTDRDSNKLKSDKKTDKKIWVCDKEVWFVHSLTVVYVVCSVQAGKHLNVRHTRVDDEPELGEA